ncbi:M16 family metallopeptidase [Anaerophaga thermohalophila]|uniref:M16 family metallopeptidase n=1 Tax=Anaerophaga thermohalophila TaxID=177400 RepID=UPI000237CAA0|nr:pitrilysin family protein [Anaerophaga thermohalophila]
MTNNTNTSPEFKTIKKIDFLPVQEFKLDNGVPVSIIKAGSQDVTKIDIEFPAGAIQAGIPLVASTTANLMQEGTKKKSSQQISETIDFYGAYLNTQTYHHHTIITFLCLTSCLPEMLNLVHEIITEPAFPKNEYEIYLHKKFEEFAFESEKVKTMATRLFGETIFGPDHPYGRQLQKKHFEIIDIEQVKAFHHNHYRPEMAKIYVAGQPGDNIRELLNRYFGQTPRYIPEDESTIPPLSPSDEKMRIIRKEDAMQSAVRIGRPLFNNHHPDFIPLQLLNTILGGYFGSRLMTTVREEKGLTYGIGSFVMPLKYSGVWVISSEVAGERRDDAIKAIFDEFRKLREEKIPYNELEMVRNYMMGELLRNFDGPFSTADIYRTLKEYEMDFGFYQKMIDYVRNVSTNAIREMAQKYLDPNDFWVVVAGV